MKHAFIRSWLASLLLASAGCFDFANYNHVTCQPGFHQCDDACVSSDDVASCGISCTPCPAPLDGNGRAVCDGTQCGIADCTNGYHVCGNTCVKNDINACGEACAVCPHSLVANETSTCDGTSCGFSCESGFHACGAPSAIACLADDSFDSCGSACEPCAITLPPNAAGTCVAGVCGYECSILSINLAAERRLTASLAVQEITHADLDGDGDRDLIVTDGAASVALAFRNQGDGSFDPGVPLPHASVGLGGVKANARDLNGDGKIDVVLAKTNTGTTQVLINTTTTGGLQFAAPVDYAIANTRTVADFDGDGILDLANGTEVALGFGDGTFGAAAAASPAQGLYGDLDGDGDLDLAYLSGSDVVLRLRSPLGGYEAPVSYAVGASATSVSHGDLNGDGIDDLFVARASQLTALVGIGAGLYASAVDVDTHGATFSVVGDFNGDGKADLAGSNFTLSNTSTPMTIAFGPRIDYYAPGGSVVTGDLNGDGRDELILGTLSDGVTILSGREGPLLAGSVIAPVVSLDADSADFNQDGRPDIVTNSAIYLGGGDGTFASPIALDSQGPEAVLARDINGDGIVDVVRLNRVGLLDLTPGLVLVSLGLGDGTMAPTVTYDGGPNPWGMTIADFDDDGHLDVLTGSLIAATVSFLHGHSDGTFDAPIASAAGTGTVALANADFDGDGKRDAAVWGPGSTGASARVGVMRGHGDGTFDTPRVFSFGASDNSWQSASQTLAIGDFNRDGLSDLAVASIDAGIYVFFGDASAILRDPIKYPVSTGAVAISAVDMNGDGTLDLVVATQNGKLSVLPGNRDGTFRLPVDHFIRSSSAVLISDFDSDSAPDVATVGTSGLTLLSNAQDQRCSPWTTP